MHICMKSAAHVRVQSPYCIMKKVAICDQILENLPSTHEINKIIKYFTMHEITLWLNNLVYQLEIH